MLQHAVASQQLTTLAAHVLRDTLGQKNAKPFPWPLPAMALCHPSNLCIFKIVNFSTNQTTDLDEHEDEEDLLCPDPPPGRRILWDYIILDEGHKVGGKGRLQCGCGACVSLCGEK